MSHGFFAQYVPHTVKHFSKNLSVLAPKRSKKPESLASLGVELRACGLSS